MSCWCCCGNDEEDLEQDIRTKESLRNILKIGGGGGVVIYESFNVSEIPGGDDPITSIVVERVNRTGMVPVLMVMMEPSFTDIMGDDRRVLIENCRIHIRDIARVILITATAEFLFIGAEDVAYDRAIGELLKVARDIYNGISIPHYPDFSLQRLDIRLYQDLNAPGYDLDPSAPLLGEKSTLESPEAANGCFLCFCCLTRNLKIPFVFDPYQKSEFGWFYADLASEYGQETLRKSIDRMSFVSENLSQEELEHLVEFFINFYMTSKHDIPDALENEVLGEFRSELANLLRKHYGPTHEIGTDDSITWFTHEMPRKYVRRCTRSCPMSFRQSCPSCVIS